MKHDKIVELLNAGYKFYEIREEWMFSHSFKIDSTMYLAKDGLTQEELYDKYDKFMFELDEIVKECLESKDFTKLNDYYNNGSEEQDIYPVPHEFSITTQIDIKDANFRETKSDEKSFLNPKYREWLENGCE